MAFRCENNIIKCEEAEYTWQKGLGELIFTHMQLYSDKTAQIEDKTQKSDTYGSLLKKCIQTAIELKKRNVKKGDIITICCFNDLNVCVPIVASYFIGAIPFVANIGYPSMWKCLLDLKPKIIFSDKASEDRIKTFLENNKEDIKSDLTVFGSSFEKEFLQQLTEAEETNFQPIHIEDLFETSNFVYSGGTTAGVPKLVALNHYNCIGLFTKIKEEPIVRVSNVAWAWVGGLAYFLWSLNKGDCRILCEDFYSVIKPDFDLNRFWEIIEKYKVEYLFVNPLIAKCLFNVDKIDYDVSSLKTFYAAGSPLLDDYYDKIKKLFPNATPINGYGSTEFGSPLTFKLDDEYHKKLYDEEIQSVGLPARGYSIKVVNPDTNEPVGPHEIGELLVKSKCLLSNGYVNREEWNKCFDEDGWFRTGDLVYYDDKFRFFVKDRLKFIINGNGYRMFPVYMESILIKHPDVQDVAVIGVPVKESSYMQNPMAAVILKDGSQVCTEDLMTFFMEQQPKNSYIHYLTGGVKFVKSFPTTNVGKVMKLKLRQMILNNEL